MKKICAVFLAAMFLFTCGCSSSSSKKKKKSTSTSTVIFASEDTVPNLSKIELNIKGTIVARDGANLCKEPSMFSKEIDVLDDKTEIKIISAVDRYQIELSEDGTWLYVSAGGKKGYVNSKYVNIVLTEARDAFSDEQWYVLGIILFRQHWADSCNLRHPRSIDIDFDREQISRTDKEGNSKYFYHICKPENLTMEQLSTEYYNEFSKQYFDGTFENYYAAENQKIYGYQELGDEMWIERLVVKAFTTATETELFYTVREQYVFDMQERLGEYKDYVYSLFYEDGRWKCGRLGDEAETSNEK